MTPADFLALDDARLTMAVFERVARLAHPRIERLLALPAGLQAIYFTQVLEDQVCNGGFQQYFWNLSARFSDETLSALILLEAPRHRELYSRALSIHEQERQVFDRYRRMGTLAAFSDSTRHTALGVLDREYFSLREVEDLTALRARCLRARIRDLDPICTPEDRRD